MWFLKKTYIYQSLNSYEAGMEVVIAFCVGPVVVDNFLVGIRWPMDHHSHGAVLRNAIAS